MIRSLKKSNWPYTWDEQALKLTVGEISEKIGTIADHPDQMFVVQFERCAEGIVAIKAAAITGKCRTPSILGSSRITPEEHLEMDLAFAVMMPFHLGKYENE